MFLKNHNRQKYIIAKKLYNYTQIHTHMEKN